MKKQTKKEHKERHLELHKCFDELVADFINHNPNKYSSEMPIIRVIEWSFKQTKNPDEK